MAAPGRTHASPTRPGDLLPDAGHDSQPPEAGPSSQWAGRRPWLPLGAGYRATPLPVRVQIPKIRVASSLDRLGRARRPGRSRSRAGRAWPAGRRSARVQATPGRRWSWGTSTPPADRWCCSGSASWGRGDEIKVTRANGSSARFVVERTAQNDKQRFPTDDVYYPRWPCAAAGDLRRAVRGQHRPLPVQQHRLRHAQNL